MTSDESIFELLNSWKGQEGERNELGSDLKDQGFACQIKIRGLRGGTQD